MLLAGDVEVNLGMPNDSSEIKKQQRNLKIAHLNVRSIKNREHYILVKDLAIKNEFDIFTISESWLDSTVTDIEADIPGYNIFRLDRSTKTGGGVCAFVSERFKIERLDDLSSISPSGLHQLWLKVQVRNCKSFIICTVYRPPTTSLNCFDEDLSRTTISALSYNKDIYILGDLNCNVLNQNDVASQVLLNFCTAFNLSQMIKQPTRITETSATLIDVILASNTDFVKEAKVLPCSVSDHDLIYLVFSLKKDRPAPVYVTTRSFKHYDQAAFRKDIYTGPWSVIDIFDDVDDKLYAFHQIFDDILDSHAPIKVVKIRSRPNPCVTAEIRALMKTRDHWRKLARKTNDPLAWAGYKNFKREVKRELRLAEQQYAETQIRNNPNNTGCIWKTIRSFIPKKSVNRKTYSKEDKLVANEFNKFFTSIGQNTIHKIQSLANECNYDLKQASFVPKCYPLSQQFTFRTVECSEIEHIVNSMPTGKAPGIDKISLRVIKDCLPAILPTLTSIISNSLTSGIFPFVWKTAEVIPIHKQSDHEKPENNRPISLLPILSKICERTVLNQFMPYLVLNKRLSTKQSGNKKWHSTETSLIHTTDMILNAIDQKKTTAMVLLDMSKAFDSISHKILLYKLQDMGASKSTIDWFRSYLSNRTQVVRISTKISDPLPLASGVPQGSILGPMLFGIYVNDLPSTPRKCLTESYVDDTKLYMSFRPQDCGDTISAMNEDLVSIRNWCFDNGLLLNPDKTKLIIYGSRQMTAKIPEFRLTLLGKDLEPTETVKDLGVIFDKNLTFNEHVIKTVSSCMSTLGQISRVKHAFRRDILITIINSLVFSKLYYCSSVWANTTDSNIKKLQGIQNFAARIVCNIRKYDHVSPALKSLNWIPVESNLYLRDAVMAFKCMMGLVPEYLSNKFTLRGSISGRVTRSSQKLNIPLCKTATGQRSFYYRIVSIWNAVSHKLKLSLSVTSFKRNLKLDLLKKFLS